MESFSSPPLHLFGWWWLWSQAIRGTYPSTATHITIIRTDMAAMRNLSLQVTGWCLSIMITLSCSGTETWTKRRRESRRFGWRSQTGTQKHRQIITPPYNPVTGIRICTLICLSRNTTAAGHTKRRFPNTDREVLKSTLSASPCLSVRCYTYSYLYAAGNLLPSKHLNHDAI